MMLTLFSVLAVVSTVKGTELVPERYLRPRNFNHHPFTDVGTASALKAGPAVIPDTHPYAILASKRPREGRQFPEQDVVLYPNPPAEVLPRKQVPTLHAVQAVQQIPQEEPQPVPLQLQLRQQQQQPVGYETDPYSLVPKNYAFSYSVKDQHSGDDFSHSQAHNGKATRGQYRVKLPDGRIQVVSYTADHKGYRADVQYEGEAAKHYAPQPTPTPIYEHPTPTPETYVHKQPSYTLAPAAYVQDQRPYSPTPASYAQEEPTYTAKPALFAQEPSYTPTPASYVPHQHYAQSPGGYAEPQYVHAYVRPTNGYAQAHYASPTSPPYEGQYAAPSPAAYDQPFPSPTPTTYQHESYPDPTPEIYRESYKQPPSYVTSSPEHQAYVTPTPTTYEQSHYGSPANIEYENGYGPSSPSPFSVQPYLRSTPAPFSKQKYVTPTEAPSAGDGQVYVTPRTIFNAALSRRGFGDRQHVQYKFTSPS